MILSCLKDVYATLERPGVEFRSLPFWGWNERMDHDALRRQLADMRDKGMGGCFIHSREGLETPYLSEEWMEDVRVSSDTAKELSLETWIYDEDKWPSGSAGGMVSAAIPDEFTAKALTLELRPFTGAAAVLADGERLITRMRVKMQGRRILSMGEGDMELVLRRERSRTSDWYNGFAPTDNLNAESVRRFLELTHERYRAHFGCELSARVRGFFTDEPNFCDFFAAFTPGRPWLPWTDDFVELFAARRGYDPTDRLALLFFDGEGCEGLRHDYWRTLTELFSERYMRQIYDWCGANGVELTGHMLYENDLGYNVRVCGAAMPQYRYMHAPGIDLLGEQTQEYLTVKQASSVARQYGRDMVVSETYGCTGWEFDFEGQKWLGDWQFALGVTRRCQHLMLYSITGCRKRDYPPCFNEQNTWWPYDRDMEDYFARLAVCASAGEAERRLLVIHPISSLWMECASAPDEDLNNVEMNMGWKDANIVSLNAEGDAYNRLAEALMRNHWDFDFGDETILAERGKVEAGRLRVGAATYDAVIVPPLRSLFASTLALLEAFASGGGRLIWMDDAPAFVEGRPDMRGRRLYERPETKRVADIPELLRMLETLFPEALRIRSRLGAEDEQLLAQFRRVGADALLIAINHSRDESREAEFYVPARGRVIAFDPWSNERRALASRPAGKGMRFIDELAPVGSRVYFIESQEKSEAVEPTFAYRHPHRTIELFAALGPMAEFERDQPNALTLDRCRFALGADALSEEMELWRAQRIIRQRLNMQDICRNGIPQRYTWLEREKIIPGAPFLLEFSFDVVDVPNTPCRFAIEKPDGLEIECNGQRCARVDGFFLDRGIALFELPRLRRGHNAIAVRAQYNAARELEDAFLLGDFAVTPERRIKREPERLRFGDWCLQGYPHYAGSMIYRFHVPAAPALKRVILRMGEVSASVCELRVNGERAALLFGKCRREAELTHLLKRSENLLEIKAVGTPRNLLGPLHRAYDGCCRISWEDFRTEGALHCDDYVLHPYGLMGQIALRLE